MAKYYTLENGEPLVGIVDKIADELDLSQYIDFQVLVTDKSKEVCKVVKANQFTEVMTERQDLVLVIINEKAFDLVEEDTKYMWIRMEMDKVSYDSEKDKINIGCPCVTVPIGMAEKYGNSAIDAAKLAIYTIDQIKALEKESKASKKKGKHPEQA